ncbi:hypothetical protein CC86DRAFT_11808 [Ophiobolus disseminans]|uniref:DUF676 domain-containing protein n=1 Tax=Ophiobolus disseminans TaxID=1469910 RepID=A0A6A7AJV7_9PLEO|nr:hypothetical protein CC86DRAFT_11808 [Ophiobolus disseminans]
MPLFAGHSALPMNNCKNLISWPKTCWKTTTRRPLHDVAAVAVDIVIVYMYNGSGGIYMDVDEDLDIFRCQSMFTSDARGSAPVKVPHRAINDIAKQWRQARAPVASVSSATADSLIDTETLQGSVWLQDRAMLETHISRSRTIMIGFDISTVPSEAEGLDIAAKHLSEFIQETGKHQQSPIVFLGHTTAGLIILRSLLRLPSSKVDNEAMCSRTAGLLLFSCPVTPSWAHAYKLAALLQFRDIKLFSILYNNQSVKVLNGVLKTQPDSLMYSRQRFKLTIGIPIVQILAHDDPITDDMSNLLYTPAQTVIMKKAFPNALQFASSEDTDFRRILLTITTLLHEYRSLSAAVAGNTSKLALYCNRVQTSTKVIDGKFSLAIAVIFQQDRYPTATTVEALDLNFYAPAPCLETGYLPCAFICIAYG